MCADVGDISNPALIRLIVLVLTLQLIGHHKCWLTRLESRPPIAKHGPDLDRFHQLGYSALGPWWQRVLQRRVVAAVVNFGNAAHACLAQLGAVCSHECVPQPVYLAKYAAAIS